MCMSEVRVYFTIYLSHPANAYGTHCQNLFLLQTVILSRWWTSNPGDKHEHWISNWSIELAYWFVRKCCVAFFQPWSAIETRLSAQSMNALPRVLSRAIRKPLLHQGMLVNFVYLIVKKYSNSRGHVLWLKCGHQFVYQCLYGNGCNNVHLVCQEPVFLKSFRIVLNLTHLALYCRV